MAGRSSTTHKKRQKELARQDKAKEKAAKRAERKTERPPGAPSGPEIDFDYKPYVPEDDLPKSE